MGPVANPVAVVQVGVACVSITHECLVVTSSRAKRACPTRVAVILRVDVSPIQKILLFGSIHAGGNVTHAVCVRIHETVARRDISGWPDTNQPKSGTAGMRLVHSLA